MPVSTPADKRFRRAHVSPARRRPRWWLSKPLWVATVVAIVAAVFGVRYVTRLVLSTDVLTVNRVEVGGNERLSSGEVMALLEGIEGENVVTVDLDTWRQRLLDSPWVADATLRRVLPTTIDVVIQERTPRGIGRIAGNLYLLDERADVIDEYGPGYADVDLPIIDGLAGASTGGRLLVDDVRAGLASRLLSALLGRPDLASRISQIDVTDARDVAVIFTGDTTLVRIGEDRFIERLQSYLEIESTLRESVPDIDYVDLRFDDRVYVRPQPEAATERLGGGD